MRILWIPHTGWHIPQRAHLFCRPLSERHEVHVTDWVADFASVRDYLSRRYLRNFTYRRYRDGRITVHGIPRMSPALFVPALRRFNQAVFSWYVRRIMERHAIDVVVGTFVVPPPRAPRLVFDWFDDNAAYWRSFGRMATYAEDIAAVERAYLVQADAIVAASSVLADRARALRAPESIHHIPNGVDLRGFDGANGERVRQELGVEGKLVGVVGNQDRRGEIERVLEVARAFREGDVTFLIAGRGKEIPFARRRVEKETLSNVVVHGYVRPERAAEVVSALDVGLCPYAKTPGAEAGCPMRLILYAAAGVPTVCTDLEEVRRMNFPNVILVGDNPRSLAEGIRCALQLPRARPSQIQAYDLHHLVAQYEIVLKD